MESLHTYLSEPQVPPESMDLLNKLPNPKPSHRDSSALGLCGAQLPPIACVPRLSLRASVHLQDLPDGNFDALAPEATLLSDASVPDSSFAEQSRSTVQASRARSNKKRMSQIYRQPGGLSTRHDSRQQDMFEGQAIIVPNITQSYDAIVRERSSHAYENNLISVRSEVGRIEESLEFVTFSGPPVRNDPALRSRIRAHVMRQVHQQKRIEKMGKSQMRTLPTQSLYLCGSNETTSSHAESMAQQLLPLTKSLLTRAVDSHLNMILDSGNSFWPAGFSVVVACQKCGKVEIFRCQTEEALTYRPYTASPRDLPGGSVLNPFAPFAVNVTHFMHEMIHHFLHWHLPKTNPGIYGKGNLYSPAIYIVDLAVTDPAAVYAMVAQGAYHRSVLINRADNKEEHKKAVMQATIFLSEALRLLQEKFDDAKSALSNVSIFITAMLASSMGIVGDKEQLEAHCKGMTRMVELRGGIDTLPRMIAHQVSRIDLNSAWVFRTQPICTMYKSRFRERSSHALIFGPAGSRNPFPDRRLQDFCSKPLFNIAGDLKYLTHLLSLHDREPHKIGLKEREYFEDNFAACQHGLASFPHLHTILVRSTKDYRQECLRLALFIYFNTGIRVTPSPRFLKSMTSALVEAFQESDLSTLWHPFPSILLWVLFMGYCGSYDPIDKGWFVQEIRRVVIYLKLGTCEDIETMLTAFLYRKSLHTQPLHELWELLPAK